MSSIAPKQKKTARDIKTNDPVKKLILGRILELERGITERQETIERMVTDLDRTRKFQVKGKLELRRLLSEIDGLETRIDLSEVTK